MNFKFQFNRLIECLKRYGPCVTIKKVILKAKQNKYDKEEKENYQIWIKENEPSLEEIERQRKQKFEYEPKISIIVPMYNTKKNYLEELIDSVIGQTYGNWELCLADGSSTKMNYIDELVSQDKRIKYKFLDENKGISENSNSALELATGEYIALLDHDDILPLFSLYEVVKTINENRDAELIYSDEDKLLEVKEDRIGPHFKPDYAPDTLMSYNYICHFAILKRCLMEKLGGFRKEFDGSQDYDLFLRATEQTDNIVHIPKILYHWRMNEDSVALSSSAKPYAYEAAKRAIAAHLDRIGVKATVKDAAILGMYNIEYEVQGNPKVSIIIPNKDHKKDLKKCINSILEKTTYSNYEILIIENNSKSKKIFDYYNEIEKNKKIKILKYNDTEFNYSKINNFGVSESTGDYIVLLNNDTKIITKNWLEIMLGNCQRNDVGIVGAKLLYKNNTVQHAGIVLGLGGVAGHVNSGLEAGNPGYMARNIICQNYNAVTGALLMISKELYNDVGGLDENLPIAYNDVDLCLKVRDKKMVVVMNPNVIAYHYESKTRGYEVSEEKQKRLERESKKIKNKWKNFFKKYDQYYNKNFRYDVGTMRIKVSNPYVSSTNRHNIKAILSTIIAIVITIAFFSYQVVISWDSAHYLELSSLFSRGTDFSQWDVIRGPIFPAFIKICTTLFGSSSSGLLVGLFAFYVVMILVCYYIYRDTLKSEKSVSKKIKAGLIILWILFIGINPMVFGFYHTLLTECIAMTFSVFSCYLAWKWMKIDFKTSKFKYTLYTIIFAIFTAIAWQLKQPYVGTVIFPVIVAAGLSFIKETNIKNLLQRLCTIIVCLFSLIIGIKCWNFVLSVENVSINQERTSSGAFSSQLLNGITEYGILDNEYFDTEEEIIENNKIDKNDKEEILNILRNESGYKYYEVIDLNQDYYKIIYSESDAISTGEAIKVCLEIFKQAPMKTIKTYIKNYLGTISVFDVEFFGAAPHVEGVFNFSNTLEISTIGYRIYNYGIDTVFYLSDELESYGGLYRSTNKPIVAVNWIFAKLEYLATMAMKICYLLLPILTIISIVGCFKAKKRCDSKYCSILELIAILFTFSFLHIVVHAILGATIDRYTMPALITTFLGILLSIYALILKKCKN